MLNPTPRSLSIAVRKQDLAMPTITTVVLRYRLATRNT
jgi:hypothetical protein